MQIFSIENGKFYGKLHLILAHCVSHTATHWRTPFAMRRNKRSMEIIFNGPKLASSSRNSDQVPNQAFHIIVCSRSDQRDGIALCTWNVWALCVARVAQYSLPYFTTSSFVYQIRHQQSAFTLRLESFDRRKSGWDALYLFLCEHNWKRRATAWARKNYHHRIE